jgi:hypothetical protein
VEAAKSVKVLGFLQAVGVVTYCGLVGLLMWKGNDIFGNAPEYIGPVAVLLLLSVSVLMCAILVFYQPYKFFFAGEKDKAAELVLNTTAWLAGFFLVFLLLGVFLR